MSYCHCGCGEKTVVPRETHKQDVRGVPRKFRHGHYQRTVAGPIIPRLERKTRLEPATGCWVWTGATTAGYGCLTYRGESWRAHRLAYELLVGPVPEALHLDHLCRNRACINPEHLEPVTPGENVRRGLGGALTTHCPRGHEYTPENTYLPPLPNKQGRVCRICRRESNRRAYARKTGRA